MGLLEPLEQPTYTGPLFTGRARDKHSNVVAFRADLVGTSTAEPTPEATPKSTPRPEPEPEPELPGSGGPWQGPR